MGLTNKAKNITYLKLKEGKFYLSTDKDLKEPFTDLEGMVTDLFYKEETFNGKVNEKLYIVVSDNDQKYVFGMSSESRQATDFLNFLASVDLTEPVTISSKLETIETGGKEINLTKLFVANVGKNSKAAFTKDNPNGLPPMKQVKVGSKLIWDKEDFINFYKLLVNKKLKPQLNSDAPTKSLATADIADEDDDLPFD